MAFAERKIRVCTKDRKQTFNTTFRIEVQLRFKLHLKNRIWGIMNEKVLKTASKWALGTTYFGEPNHLWLNFNHLQKGRIRLLCAHVGKFLRFRWEGFARRLKRFVRETRYLCASYESGWIKGSHSIGKAGSQSSNNVKCLCHAALLCVRTNAHVMIMMDFDATWTVRKNDSFRQN